eukprot:417548-Rhodomonas_salina.2
MLSTRTVMPFQGASVWFHRTGALKPAPGNEERSLTMAAIMSRSVCGNWATSAVGRALCDERVAMPSMPMHATPKSATAKDRVDEDMVSRFLPSISRSTIN